MYNTCFRELPSGRRSRWSCSPSSSSLIAARSRPKTSATRSSWIRRRPARSSGSTCKGATRRSRLSEGAVTRCVPGRPVDGRRSAQGRRTGLWKARGRTIAADDDFRLLVPDAATDWRLDLLDAADAGRRPGGAFSFGKARARMLDETNNAITFADDPAATRPRKKCTSSSSSCATRRSSSSSEAGFLAAC